MKTKKTIIRPAAGQPLRPEADTPRTRHLFAEFFKDEKKEIFDYCLRHKISVSQFLTEVALEDAEGADKSAKPATLTLSIPGEQSESVPIPNDELYKIRLLARAQRKPLFQVVLDRILYNLKTSPWNVQETEPLRYYVSKKEHQTIRDHVNAKGVSGRSYVAMLALKKVRADKK